MKVLKPLAFAVGIASVSQIASAKPATAAPTKVITLDSDIVPSWDDLGTNARSWKIKLERVAAYWDATEARDKKVAKTFYNTLKEDNAAQDKVEAFYDGAAKCLAKQKVKDRKTRSEVDTALKEIKNCISKTVSTPSFTVSTSVDLPKDYGSPVDVDFRKALKDDEDADLKDYSKVISLDTAVPSWDQLGTNAHSVKIKLNRLKSYWAAAEARGKKTVETFYAANQNDDDAVDKVHDFYNVAENCMEKQAENVRKTRADIDAGLREIKDCIIKKAKPLDFTVVKTVNLPAFYSSPLAVDYGKAIQEDEDADRREATPAPTPTPPTKEIKLDHEILPTWDQLGTNAKTKKIRLRRISSYWSKTEARDKKAVKKFYNTKKEDAAAVEKIDTFYDGAKKCLAKQNESQLKTRKQVDQALKEIGACIDKTVAVPVFTVLASIDFPDDYFSPVGADDDDGDANDDDDDNANDNNDEGIAVVPAAPTVAPVPQTLSPVVTAAPPPTKEISLNYDIVPTWEDLGTTPATKKIRLFRVYSYWAKTEARDKQVVKTFYSTTKEDDAAADKVDAFYDGARACLAKQKELERKTHAEVDAALKEIRDCIIQSVVPPVFSVLTSVRLPDEYFSPIVVDYTDTNAADKVEDAAEVDVQVQTAPEITTAPLVAPIPTTEPEIEATAAPYAPPTWPPSVVDTETPSPATEVNYATPEDETPHNSDTEAPATTPNEEPWAEPAAYEPETEPTTPSDVEEPQHITEPTNDVVPAVPASEDKEPSAYPGVPNDELPSPPSNNVVDEEPHSEDVNPDAGDIISEPTPADKVPHDEEPQLPTDVVIDEEPQPAVEPIPEPGEGIDTGYIPGAPAPIDEEPSIDIVPGVEPQPVIDNGLPLDIVTDIHDTPVPLPDLPTPPALEWPFSPASPDVPPFWALDLDQSESVDASEWQKYVEHLHALAREAVVLGRDPVAVALLKQIVDFHYGSLAQCITTKLKADEISILTESDYEPVAHWIETNCYVKFRYSLLAGAPPFEWVAKDKAIVTANEIEVWFTKRVNTARKDLAWLPDVSAAQKGIVERFIGCAYASLRAAGPTPIHRDAFYSALSHIEQCADA